LWWPEERILVVADLHLEKGAAFARRGQMLPPYDTAATLAILAYLVASLDPRCVIALGDSFHESPTEHGMSPPDRTALALLQRGRDWIWVAGNHDPELPDWLGGSFADALAIGPLGLVHEPSAMEAAGEIAGHLHPAARVAGRSGTVRRRCFVGDGRRMVLPAFGAFAGGLNILEEPFGPLFADGFVAHVLGADAVYRVERSRLCFG
jgi:hypothetical protein